MADALEGASLEVHYPEPALDLASLAACLAEAVPAPAAGAHVQERHRRPLLRWSPAEGALGVDTRAVLSRLTTTRPFRALRPARDAGFFRDVGVPSGNARAYLGGRIVDGTGGQLQRALDRLVASLDAEIAAAVAAGFDPEALAAPAELSLRVIGGRVGERPDDHVRMRTRVRRTTLEHVGASQRDRREELARLMAAVEEVEGDRAEHFERMAGAVRELLLGDGLTEREIGAALAHHRDQAQTPGTQLARFFDFLEDAALARIRLQVTFRMMEAIAAAAAARTSADDPAGAALLIDYVRRTAALYQALTGPDGEALSLNLSREFGAQADFSLLDELVTAGFADCLPVWPQWVAQIFERQQRGPGPVAFSTREVSYRFRVNGINPDAGQSAYVARLDRIRAALLGSGEPYRVRRSLAELVFLAAAVPAPEGAAGPDGAPSRDAALPAAREAVQALERGGRSGIESLLTALRARAPSVDRVSRALIRVLKTRGTAVTASLAGRTWDYHVNVLRSIVNPQRIGSPLDRPLAAQDTPSGELIDFFRHVRISEDRPLPGSLFSLRVRVRLAERSLQAAGDPVVGQIARVLPARWAQVVWRPVAPEPPAGAAGAAGTGAGAGGVRTGDDWLAPARVEVWYDVRQLGLNRGRDETAEQLLAAFRCAFAVLVYATLLGVFRRLAGPGEPPGRLREALTVGMLRIQRSGREAETWSGEQGVFAAAHAVELALGRDLDVRLQGAVLGEAPPSAQKRRGLYGALFAGFPLVLERRGGGALEPAIGLVTFASRPCNGLPERPDDEGEILCVARTYLATAVSDPFRGYRIGCVGGPAEVRDGRAAAALPSVVVEEIRRLHEALGCRHVLLLAHPYGRQRIGWAAGRARRARHLGRPGHLAALAAALPEVCVYPLIRDTFPVTRLRERGRDEDAFEILSPDAHLRTSPEESRELRHAYTPVYSLATLHVVGEAGKPQSGVCTYFLLRDSAAGPVEAAERVRANLLLPESPVRADLLAVLRGVHYLEAERPAMADGTLRPVLDPYAWMQPDTIGHAGEVVASASRRRAGQVVLSLSAGLELVSRIVHALPPRAT